MEAPCRSSKSTQALCRRSFSNRAASAATCVEINHCIGCWRRVDGVEDDAMIRHERAVKF